MPQPLPVEQTASAPPPPPSEPTKGRPPPPPPKEEPPAPPLPPEDLKVGPVQVSGDCPYLQSLKIEVCTNKGFAVVNSFSQICVKAIARNQMSCLELCQCFLV